MQTLEEYLGKRKRKDHMDEFDLSCHSENMTKAIQYVMDYFNTYLNIDEISQEQIKLERAVDKIRSQLEARYPEQTEAIVDFYLKHRKRLDRIVEDAYSDAPYYYLIYTQEEEKAITTYICKHILRQEELTPELPEIIGAIVHQYRMNMSASPMTSQMIDVDDTLVQWVKETYSKYHVNLLDFASGIASEYYHRYVEYKSTYYNDRVFTYFLINYEYRYKNNPFNIDKIYSENENRSFITGRKGALEMLIMYHWLFECVNDEEYWPEYVLLCERAGKIVLTSKKRTLIPVQTRSGSYPAEIHSKHQYIETFNGNIPDAVEGKYILRVTYKKGDDSIWKDSDKMESLILNLRTSFEKYGNPVLLEIDSPYKDGSLTEEEFISQYIRFERAIAKRTEMKIALVNGSIRKTKGKSSMFATVEDIIRLQKICRERRLKLKLAISFSNNRSRDDIGEHMSETVDALIAVRKSIIAIHLNALSGWSGYYKAYSKDTERDSRYLYIDTGVAHLSQFLSYFATMIQDGRPRYFIPDSVSGRSALEELVDYLFRAGIDFESEAVNDE